jgi:NAD(P)-dependent dehydrogenase (short-subunit alcohol dehydrogenase family)
VTAVLVTGGASGIGRATALRAAAAGRGGAALADVVEVPSPASAARTA